MADLTIEILKQIRDAVVETNSRVDQTNARLDETNTNLATLARRQTETEVRLATEIVALASAVNGVRDVLHERLDDRTRVDDHERRIRALERRRA